MYGLDPRPIVLAIQREGSCLSVSLSDARAVARFGRVDADARALEEVRAHAVAVLQHPHDGGHQALDAMLRGLGSDIFMRLLPEGIRTFLTRSPPRFLQLQISESLVAIPWELAFDGAEFVGEKFRVARQIILDEETPPVLPARPPRGVMKVLVVTGAAGPAPGAAELDALLPRLDAIEGLSAQRVCAADLRPAEALRLMGDSDVVHYVGPLGGRPPAGGDIGWWNEGESTGLRRIAGLAYPPRLLVSVDTRNERAVPSRSAADLAIAKAACRSGLNLLICAPGRDASGVFTTETYRELARGAPLGEAVRQASAIHRRSAEQGALSCRAGVLYGDATVVPNPASGRGRQQDHVRQVTTLAYDLVDSTGLMRVRGTEEYSELLTSLHERCASIVRRRNGQPDAPQGDDGIMCYFGFPVAREDSATQAVRAALEIVDAVGELDLKVRIGIATGQVVVKEDWPHGPSIHLAARLRGMARPGTVIIAESTRRIVKDRFAFKEGMKARKLKSFKRRTKVHRVLAELTDRSDAKAPSTPFVGRQRDLARIEEEWTAATGGELRTVLVFGEAGMGKSRLVREFRRSAGLPADQVVECRCAQDHATSAYHPLIDFIRRLLRMQDGDSDASKFERISALAAKSAIEGAAELLAALLSVPLPPKREPLKLTPERQRQLTLELLVEWIVRESGRAPICLIVEDVQWIDPSSREFLNRLVATAPRRPLLVLYTERLIPRQRHSGISAMCEIELKGLPRDAVRKMILGVRGASAIPGHILRLLGEKADGVPLFIEESTRMAVERKAGSAPGSGLSALSFTVPAGLDDLLMERVDQLGTAKLVAQLGGTIGREFPLALMKAVLAHERSPISIDNLEARLGTLIGSGLLVEKGEAPNTSYYFRHALIREAAYKSLLDGVRRPLHSAIAAVVREQFPILRDSQPELLAYHYTQAGIDVAAVEYWERAALLARSRSAHAEAISHLNNGLGLVERLPLPGERDRTELRMQLALAAQLIATAGYGANEVGRVCARASDLSRMLGDEESLTKAQFGLEAYHFMHADFDKAYAIATQAAGVRPAHAVRKLQSMWAVAHILFHRGELVSAVERMDACLDEYHRSYRIQPSPSAVQDPGVMCLCYSAWGKWQLGYPDEAIARAKDAVARSEKQKHPFSMGEAYGFCSSVHHFRGENDEALKCAERAIEICEDSGFAVWLAHAKLMRGRIVAEQGDGAAGIAEMREAYKMWSDTQAVVTTPFYLAMQAEGCALVGRPEEGLALLRMADKIVQRHEERYYEAEVLRLMGELTLQSAALRRGEADAEAERWFLGALDSAGARELRSMTLRSATSLSRLRITQGRREEALQILAPAYECLREGKDTRDVRVAGALVQQLRLAGASA